MLRKLLKVGIVLGCLSVVIPAFALDDTSVKVNWGYSGEKGPNDWAALNPNFALCGTGQEQSPVNIPRKVWGVKNVLAIHYQSAPMIIIDDGTTELMIDKTQTLINDGHGVQLNFPVNEAKEWITLAGKDYRLVQLHMHTPSETQIQGHTFPLEIHFVHQSDDGKLAVIGVLVNAGRTNPIIQKIVKNLPKQEGKEKVVRGERINPENLLPVERTHYAYEGSLTVPPCVEGVQWIVMADTIMASSAQIAQLKRAAGGANARSVQALNGRVVSYSNK